MDFTERFTKQFTERLKGNGKEEHVTKSNKRMKRKMCRAEKIHFIQCATFSKIFAIVCTFMLPRLIHFAIKQELTFHTQHSIAFIEL